LTQKLRKLRQKTKEEEDQYSEHHKNASIIEERCRNMKEIVKASKNKKKERNEPPNLSVEELEEQYRKLVFTKEEILIKQESELNI
jgi:hypothetical protein